MGRIDPDHLRGKDVGVSVTYQTMQGSGVVYFRCPFVSRGRACQPPAPRPVLAGMASGALVS